MRGSSARRREVDIFNFSFLDILACVIGLLIFVLTIVVITGGPSRGRRVEDGRLATADREVAMARTDADLAAQRRANAERALAQRAEVTLYPDRAEARIQDEIREIDGEVGALRQATEQADRNANAAREEAHRIRTNLGDTATKSLLDDAQDLHRQARQLSEEARKPGRGVTVNYYVPKVHDSERGHGVMVEIDGDMLYVLNEQNYVVTLGESDTASWRRRSSARGVSVSRMVAGFVSPPAEIAQADGPDTRLGLCVRPDGYDACRTLRTWAWKQKFGVMWWPTKGGETIVTVKSKMQEQ